MAAAQNLVSDHCIVDGQDRLEERYDRAFGHQSIELDQGHGPITILALQRLCSNRLSTRRGGRPHWRIELGLPREEVPHWESVGH